MRLTRTLVLALAVAAAAGAAALVRQSVSLRTVSAPPAPPAMAEILVAARAIEAGERVAEADTRWTAWPEDAVPAGAVRRRPGAGATSHLPAIARYPLLAGEPVAPLKLTRHGAGSHAAALIAHGNRAVAVPVREESAAGGLIQPHDRVDVLWTPPSEASGSRPAARLLLRAVKVLAVGRSLQAGNARGNAGTATLELTQEEARILAGARARGEVSLALIAAGDPAADAGPVEQLDDAGTQPAIRIMKFGRGLTPSPRG